jgi:hypothetical protein
LPTEAVAETNLAAKVRPITYADVDWFMDIGRRRYPPDWSLIGTEAWLRKRVLPNPESYLAIRSDHAATVTMLSAQHWTPHRFEALVQTTMAEEGCMWELFPLLRASQDWARKRRCVNWKIATETEYDLGPMARRVGAKEAKYWIVDF